MRHCRHMVLQLCGMDLLAVRTTLPTDELAWVVCTSLFVLTMTSSFAPYVHEMVERCNKGAGHHFDGMSDRYIGSRLDACFCVILAWLDLHGKKLDQDNCERFREIISRQNKGRKHVATACTCVSLPTPCEL